MLFYLTFNIFWKIALFFLIYWIGKIKSWLLFAHSFSFIVIIFIHSIHVSTLIRHIIMLINCKHNVQNWQWYFYLKSLMSILMVLQFENIIDLFSVSWNWNLKVSYWGMIFFTNIAEWNIAFHLNLHGLGTELSGIMSKKRNKRQTHMQRSRDGCIFYDGEAPTRFQKHTEFI